MKRNKKELNSTIDNRIYKVCRTTILGYCCLKCKRRHRKDLKNWKNYKNKQWE